MFSLFLFTDFYENWLIKVIDLNSPWRKGRPKWGPAQLTKNILSQDRHSLGKPQNRQRGEMGKTALSCCSLLIRLQKPSKNSPCMYLPQFTRCKTVRHNRISFIFLFIHWSSLNAIFKSIENVTFVNHYPVHSYGKLVKYFLFYFIFLATACGVFIPHPGIKPLVPAVEAQSLNRWTTRKVPLWGIFKETFKVH